MLMLKLDFYEKMNLISAIQCKLIQLKDTRHNYYKLIQDIEDSATILEQEKKINCCRNMLNNVNENIDLSIELLNKLENLI